MPFPPSYVDETVPVESSRSTMCREFKEYRQSLNQLQSFVSHHPQPEKVSSWSITAPMDTVKALQKDRQLIYVDTEDKFNNMCTHLSHGHFEISLDAEFGQNLYLDCISIFQISCTHFDYVIDDFLMFPFVNDSLGPIFLNPSIVKLVFSEHDIRAFVRDHKLYFVGVVDLQNICSKYLNDNMLACKPVMSLSEVCKIMLSVELDKSFQRYNYMQRPLNPKAIMYAANDSKILLSLWNKIKTVVDIRIIDLSHSKKITLCSYSFPKIKYVDAKVDFEGVLNDLVPKFCTVNEYNDVKSNLIRIFRSKSDLFEKLWLTRIECSKLADCRPKSFINVKDLGKIFRFLPQSVEYLLVLIPYLKKWDVSILDKIISVIKNEVKSVELERTEVEVANQVETESWEAADRPSTLESVSWEATTRPSPTATLDTNVEPKEMSISPISVFDSDEEGQISLDALTLTLPVPGGIKELTSDEKKKRNYLKKLANKNRLLNENNLRHKLNLPIITKSKNCGIKKRERSKLRRTQGHFMGPTTIPRGGFQSRRECKSKDYALR